MARVVECDCIALPNEKCHESDPSRRLNVAPMNRVLNLILSHQPARAVSTMIAWWKEYVPIESILIAHGGKRTDFEAIDHEQKIFVDDPRLRTKDHQRELQSYTRLFQAAAKFLDAKGEEWECVYFAEYDHVPLVRDLNKRQMARLSEERADVLGFHLHRVDGTSNPHFLYHVANDGFMRFWQSITRRAEASVVLSMFGSGSFWKRDAFCAVAKFDEPFPIYMELYLPTLAHHLGFRLRDFPDQNQFVRVLENERCSIEQARLKGAWSLHPVKEPSL